jgi:hypothetical protein
MRAGTAFAESLGAGDVATVAVIILPQRLRFTDEQPSRVTGCIAFRASCSSKPRGPGNVVPAAIAICFISDIRDGSSVGGRVATLVADGNTSRPWIRSTALLAAGRSTVAVATQTRPGFAEDGLPPRTTTISLDTCAAEPFGVSNPASDTGIRGLTITGTPTAADARDAVKRGAVSRGIGPLAPHLVLGTAATPVLTGAFADAALTTPLGLYRAALPSCGGAAPRD